MTSYTVLKVVFIKFIFFTHLCICVSINDDFSTEERALVYPPFTVLQFVAGLAVPAQVPNRTVITNWGTLLNIPLPSKIQQLYPHVRRNARHRLFTHDQVFKFFERASFFSGNAEQCVLKTICQVSQSKIDEDDLLAKLLRLLFSLSHSKYAVSEKDYFIAEQKGRGKNTSCSQMYPSCDTSLLDFVSDID